MHPSANRREGRCNRAIVSSAYAAEGGFTKASENPAGHI